MSDSSPPSSGRMYLQMRPKVLPIMFMMTAERAGGGKPRRLARDPIARPGPARPDCRAPLPQPRRSASPLPSPSDPLRSPAVLRLPLSSPPVAPSLRDPPATHAGFFVVVSFFSRPIKTEKGKGRQRGATAGWGNNRRTATAGDIVVAGRAHQTCRRPPKVSGGVFLAAVAGLQPPKSLKGQDENRPIPAGFWWRRPAVLAASAGGHPRSWVACRHRLYGHIDGSTPTPPKYIDREVKRTVVADQGAGTSAGSEIRVEYETLIENNPEYEVWLAHDQSLVAYITSTLREEVLGGVDDDLTALELWSTLATTYSQLAAIGHPVSDKDKVQQALSGLGTNFDIFCTALEVLPVLPSFEDLKAKLFQHEASRVQRHNLIPSNSHNVLIIGTHALQGNRTRLWTSQAGMGRGILPTPPGMNTTSTTPRRVPTCFYCNKRGHVKSECWHNPQNKNNQIRHENKAAAGPTSSSSGSNATSNISADVQQLLMTALSKLHLKQNEQGEWYVDSEEAAHVTGDTEMLPEQKEPVVNEPETLVNSSLDSTTSLDSLHSSSQPNDPPIDNRFSGLVYSRRSVPTANVVKSVS
ncbi:hypothetical protein EJ110_NYTH52484 [Nymphaea thermarum]|nr:hypothetical protein EJ110_NYTH52484 [Nymphaea thermarum]